MWAAGVQRPEDQAAYVAYGEYPDRPGDKFLTDPEEAEHYHLDEYGLRAPTREAVLEARHEQATAWQQTLKDLGPRHRRPRGRAIKQRLQKYRTLVVQRQGRPTSQTQQAPAQPQTQTAPPTTAGRQAHEGTHRVSKS